MFFHCSIDQRECHILEISVNNKEIYVVSLQYRCSSQTPDDLPLFLTIIKTYN